MSQTEQMTAEDSYNVLVTKVHAPVFFKKLASVYGIDPQTPEEARELLLMAAQLRNAKEQDNQKQASYNGSLYAGIRQDLSKALNAHGYAPAINQDLQIYKAAEAAVQDPVIKEAALVYASYLSQQLQSN